MDKCNDFANLTDLTFNTRKFVCFAIGALCENAKKCHFLESDSDLG